MAIIGRNDNTGATETPDFETDDQLISLNANIWTATANQQVFRFGFNAGASHNSTCPVSISLYDMSAAVSSTDPDGATLVASGTISSPTAGTDNTVDITAVALTEGRDYAVCFKIDDTPAGAGYYMRQDIGGSATTYRSDNPGSVAFDDPFAGTGTVGTWEYVVWAETEDVPASQSIDDINTDEVIDNAEASLSITYSGFTNQSGTFTLALRSTTDTSATTSCTAVSLAAGSGTFTGPDILSYTTTAAAGVPFTTANNSVEALLTETDAEPDETATLGVTFNPVAATHAVVEVASATKAAGSVFENFVGSIPDFSQVYYPIADTTSVSSTGILTTDKTSGSIDMFYFDKTAGTWEKFSVIISSASDLDGQIIGFTPGKKGMLWY